MSEQFKPCDETNLCKFMAERVGDGGKGLKALYTVRMDAKPGEDGYTERLLGVAYKTCAKDKGLLLNVCPWCQGKPGHFERQMKAPA